jgi:hypothetical protein
MESRYMPLTNRFIANRFNNQSMKRSRWLTISSKSWPSLSKLVYWCNHQATRLLMVLGWRWPRINFWCLFILLPWTSSGLDELRTVRLSKIFPVQLWDRHLSQWNMWNCIQVVALYCLFSTRLVVCVLPLLWNILILHQRQFHVKKLRAFNFVAHQNRKYMMKWRVHAQPWHLRFPMSAISICQCYCFPECPVH